MGWGVVLIVVGLLAWVGQTVSWFAPRAATRLNLVESEDSVEPVYWADIRGEALWDFLTLWTLVAAGILLVVEGNAWPYFGLVGGGIYVYFAGRGILTRIEMRRRGFRVGTPKNVLVGLISLAVWGVVGLVTIVAAARTLAG
jgi:hypothetical protein